MERLEGIFREQIIPLLQEYFFEDWQRIQWVLNDHRKEPIDCFLQQPVQPISELFGDGVPVSKHGERWELNPAAFKNVDAYLGIIDHTVRAKAQPRYHASEAANGDFTVRQLDSGTIEVLRNGVLVKPSKPILRDLAETLNISTLTSSGTPLNTRMLGRKIIESLGKQSA